MDEDLEEGRPSWRLQWGCGEAHNTHHSHHHTTLLFLYSYNSLQGMCVSAGPVAHRPFPSFLLPGGGRPSPQPPQFQRGERVVRSAKCGAAGLGHGHNTLETSSSGKVQRERKTEMPQKLKFVLSSLGEPHVRGDRSPPLHPPQVKRHIIQVGVR